MSLHHSIIQALQTNIDGLEAITLYDIFSNYRNNEGLQLTNRGLFYMEKVFTSYTINSSIQLRPLHKLTLDKEMEWPYHILPIQTHKTITTDETCRTRITLFNEYDYLELKMYDGDIDRWVKARRL